MLLAPQTTEFPHARKIAFVVGVAVALAIAFVLTGMIPTIPAQP